MGDAHVGVVEVGVVPLGAGEGTEDGGAASSRLAEGPKRTAPNQAPGGVAKGGGRRKGTPASSIIGQARPIWVLPAPSMAESERRRKRLRGILEKGLGFEAAAGAAYKRKQPGRRGRARATLSGAHGLRVRRRLSPRGER